jgi:homoserine acetyltransferase
MSNIIGLQDANSAQMEIYKQDNKVFLVLQPDVYDMLIIECKLALYDITAGKSNASVIEAIKQRKVIATINTAPMSKDLPTH